MASYTVASCTVPAYQLVTCWCLVGSWLHHSHFVTACMVCLRGLALDLSTSPHGRRCFRWVSVPACVLSAS